MGPTGERVSVAVSLAAVALVALACKGSGANPGAVDAAAAPAASASSAAPELERYSDEENPDAVVVTLKKPTTARLSADTSSKVVGELKAGDKIVPVALHGDYALVALGTDPGAASKGWIPGDVIIDALKPKAAAVAAKAALPKCKDEELLVRDKVTAQPRCAAQCTEDTDCKPGKCSDGLVLDEKTGNPAVVNGDTHIMSVCNAAAKSGAKPAAAAKDTCACGPGQVLFEDANNVLCAVLPCKAPMDSCKKADKTEGYCGEVGTGETGNRVRCGHLIQCM
ncbi:MAG TPA: hypothetical protein VF316_20030 [Polyangiaceae bacterium]